MTASRGRGQTHVLRRHAGPTRSVRSHETTEPAAGVLKAMSPNRLPSRAASLSASKTKSALTTTGVGTGNACACAREERAA